MLHSVPSLDLMAVVSLLIGVKEEEEAGKVTLAAIITSTLASPTVEKMGAPPSKTPGATATAETTKATPVASTE